MGNKTYVSYATAECMFSHFPLAEWIQAGVVPTDEAGWLNLQFLQRVRAFTGDQPPTVDRALLCMLEWQTIHLSHLRFEVSQAVDQLLESPNFITVLEVARLFGRSDRAIARWVQAGFLPCVELVKKYRRYVVIRVFLLEDVLRIQQIMSWPTTEDVATNLGITTSRVAWLVKAGRLSATMTPEGWRFDPDALMSCFMAQNIGVVTQPEACAIIGIAKAVFMGWVTHGHITLLPEKRGKQFLYSQADVLRVKSEIETLRGDFAQWLPAPHTAETNSSQEAAKKLGISKHTLGRWTSLDLLPHFDPSAPEVLDHHSRRYLASYINELAAFAAMQGDTQATQATAIMFKEQMRVRYTSPGA